MCGLSGGVDSTVAAVLLHRALGERLTCVFVDNGLLRLDEAAQVRTRFARLGLPLEFVDATDTFLGRLAGVTDPEKKRKIIGATFIDVFEARAKTLGTFEFLAQGTLYPDVIESVSVVGPSAAIKSHHNVGGLPERMKFKLVEPLRELFKDEVRAVGTALGLDDEFVWRQPFPGPGLAVRLLGPLTGTQPRTSTARRRDRGRRGQEGGMVPSSVAVVCGAAAGAERGRHGRRADVRVHRGGAGGREPRRHDGRLGAVAARFAGRDLLAAS